MPNAMDSKHGKHVSRDSPDMTPLKYFKEGHSQGHITSKIFGC